MQVLLFQVRDERYAIDARVVSEVIPAVHLRAVPGTVPAVTGLLDYRGAVVPVVDLGVVFGHGASPARMSSRIAICDLVEDGARAADTPRHARFVGVLAEQMTRVGDVNPEAQGTHPGPKSPEAPALGRILKDDEGLLQLVTISRLLPPDVLDALVEGNEAPAAPTGEGS